MKKIKTIFNSQPSVHAALLPRYRHRLAGHCCGRINGSSAFTLPELVISLTIFIMFLALAGSSYVSIAAGNRTADSAQRAYRDVRHVFDTLAADIRSSSVDFSCIDRSAIESPAECTPNRETTNQTVLLLTKKNARNEERTFYKFENGAILNFKQSRENKYMPWATVFSWQPLIASSTHLDEGFFTVVPEKNPYAQENAGADELQWQPSVGITIKINPMIFQTTFSSRNYGRKIY